MNNRKEITVIGATGNLGAPVVKRLVEFGFNVKVIVRDENKAKKIFDKLENVGIVYGDLKDVASLRKALTGTSYLYLNLSTFSLDVNTPFATEREGMANIVEAVDPKFIKQIIAISGLGAFDNHQTPGKFEFIPNIIRKQGHKILKDSGIPYTILHCSWFIDSFVFYRRKGVYSVIGNAKNPIYFINAIDYALQVANAVGNSDAFYKEFPIQGPNGIGHFDAARKFLAVYSKETKVKILPTKIIGFISLFSKEMKFVKHMADYADNSREEFIAEECGTYKVLGTPSLSVTDYATKLKNEDFYNYLAKN